MAILPDIHALWVGSMLGPIEAACLTSFAAAGHRVILHSYGSVGDLPAGVRLADAAKILPENQLVRHRQTGSFSLSSNLFRYRLLESGLGIYVDCDVYCLKPLPDADYVFGYETDFHINGAVLKLPSGSPLLAALTSAAVDRSFIPPWLSRSERVKLSWMHALRLTSGAEDLPWGTMGPHALTHYTKALGMMHRAQTADVFYPVHATNISTLFDPELTIADITTKRTHCIHLYNQMIRRAGNPPIPPSSPLGRMIASAASFEQARRAS